MSKVAINGQKIPLVPLAGGVAGLLAAIGFFMLPQSVLEAFVYQLRLDTVLPAARLPLGTTARVLAAVGAGVVTGLFTALLAWKFAKTGGSSSAASQDMARSRRFGQEAAAEEADQETGRSRRFGREPVVEPTPEAPLADPIEAEPVQITATKPEKKSRFSLKRKAKQDEIDVAAMPVTRNRGLTGAVQRESVFDHDDQGAGNALDISTATDSLNERHVDLPDWAYAEDCDLSGVRSGITQPADPNASVSDAVPVIDESEDPFELQAFQPEAFQPEPYEPAVDSATDNEIRAAAPAVIDQVADSQDVGSHDVGSHGVGWTQESNDVARPASAGEAHEWGEADWSEGGDEDGHPADDGEEAQVEQQVAPAHMTSPPAASTTADIVAETLSRMPVEDASIEELLERAEAGLRRRAEARAALQAAAAVAPVSAPAVEASAAEAPAANPFAGFEHKEAEVDEALRAALSTLERMNRRSA